MHVLYYSTSADYVSQENTWSLGGSTVRESNMQLLEYFAGYIIM